ncbi:site-specific integrase [Corynebacterium xerosis]|uniref:tyrosine-type recombinase/integrase n=1 Tax=Corynebacterium xerosis TaxID=1725 RepID=UPI000EB4B369|nr:site-specific integrase [Corynebacterium xerosis]AYJ33223.1 site-specific integrase [Corynebacterium xerosis]
MASRYAPDWNRIEQYEIASGKRWRVEYVNPASGKKTRKSGFKTQGDARRWWRSRHAATARGEATSESVRRQTVEDLWRARVEPTVTRPAYRSAWRQHVQPAWGHRRLVEITPPDIRLWDAEMRQEGQSYATRRGALATLRGILSVAVELRLIPANPAFGLRLTTIDAPGPRQHHLTRSQAQTLIAAASERDGKFIRFLLATGMRLGEAASLRVSDVQQESRTVLIPHTKNREPRTLPLGEAVWGDVARRIHDAEAGNPLWPSPAGFFMDADNWRSRQWGPAVEVARKKDPTIPVGLTPHDLRHTFASWAISQNVDIKTLQTLLGHKTAAMTMDIYGHLMPGHDRTAIDAISTLLTNDNE